MFVEHINAMLEAMAGDMGFAEQMQPLISGGDTSAIIAAAAEKGLAITPEEWDEYIAWSKKQKAKGGKTEISLDELEAVSGGHGRPPWDPAQSGCWFHAASEPEFRDGAMRQRCNQFACTALVAVRGFERCGCYGTSGCVNNWHTAGGC